MEFCSENCRSVDILARTIYGEARGESLKGKEAIANVILNRIKKASLNRNFWWGHTIEQVCLKPYQFSCWNKNDVNYRIITNISPSDAIFQTCQRVARRAICGLLEDNTQNATHYHSETVSPKWALGKAPCVSIGSHLFYNNI